MVNILKKALMIASVASMIDLFNRDNIEILQTLGYEVDISCNFESGSITSQEKVNSFKDELLRKHYGVYHIPIPRSIMKIHDIIKSYRIIKALCANNNYEIVHCHSPIGGVIARLACKNYRQFGTKVIYTAHGFHFFKGSPKRNWLIYYTIEKYVSKFTDCIITINNEDYENAKKFKSNMIEYVPGIGVNVEKIQNIQVDKIELRSELQLHSDDFVLLAVGQLSTRKNHVVTIKALSLIPNDKIKLVICGLGEKEKYLRDLVNELNLSHRVVITGFRSDIYKILHIVDCFVFPSLQEGLPVSLMEAMSIGLPIICSKIRGNTDLIQNGENGFLHEPDDYIGFSKSIIEISNNETLRSKMRELNLSRIENYDREIIKQKMEIIYKKITSKT